MIKIFAVAAFLVALSVSAAGAMDRPGAERVQPQAAAPSLDLSRTVTLTGHELQAYIKAQVLAAQAEDAARAAMDVGNKVREAMTVPAEEPAQDK
jgi:hypothetical protein